MPLENARSLRSARMHTTARGAATQRGALTRSEVKPTLGASRCLTDTAARTRNARCRHAMRVVATSSEALGARRKQPHNTRGRRCTTQEARRPGILAPLAAQRGTTSPAARFDGSSGRSPLQQLSAALENSGQIGQRIDTRKSARTVNALAIDDHRHDAHSRSRTVGLG